MKLRAIRVAEVGRFDQPVALEGLSGGLDVLVGPNEAGKSTLLRAMRLALTENHRSTQKDIRDLQPYKGGVPLVEVDFELGGAVWRMRKRFLAERMAELTNLGTGGVARGGDAETKLGELLGESRGHGRLGLLWLDQGTLLDVKKEINVKEETGRNALEAVLALEIAAAAGGDVVRRLRGQVQERLGDLVTTRTRKGRFLAATREAELAAQVLGAAQLRQSEVESLTARLGELACRAAEIGNKDLAAARSQKLAGAEAALTATRESETGRDRARLARAQAQSVHEKAAAALKALMDHIAGLQNLDADAATDAAAFAEHGGDAALGAADKRCAEALQGLEGARATLHAAEGAFARARAYEAWAGLAEIAAKAEAAAGRAEALRQSLQGLPGDPAMVADARRMAARIGEGEARLEAQSAALSVDYLPDAGGRVHALGRAVGQGERLVVSEPLLLDIDGIGRITIEPGLSADRMRLGEEVARARAQLKQVLMAADALDMAALEERHGLALVSKSQLDEALAGLRAMAPDGVAALLAKRDALGQTLDGAGGRIAPEHSAKELEATLPGLRQAVDAAAQQLRSQEQGREQALREQERYMARVSERQKQRAGLAALLPPPDQLEPQRQRLEAAARAASVAYDEAIRSLSAWEQRVADAGETAALVAKRAEVVAEIEKAREEATRLANERARAEGKLEEAGAEDIATRVAVAEAEAQRTMGVLGAIEDEVEALQLLDSELKREEEQLKAQFLRPVTARLGPFLDLVFPGAQIEMSDTFAVAGVSRGGEAERPDRLSDGTREQIAVLVRLGFGRLLADQGMAVPLILDDAMVYSDDQRLAAMHRALEVAATAHQVIVLTCREQSFAGLGGHRVDLGPWVPA